MIDHRVPVDTRQRSLLARALSRDRERLVQTSENFIGFATIRLMLKRLAGGAHTIPNTRQEQLEPSLLAMLRGLQRWVEVVVEQALYERLTAPYADLIEDVGEVVLHRVLGDAEHSGNLLGRGASYYQLYDLLLSVAKPISGGFDPGDFFWPGGFYDDHHLARMFGTCFCEGTLQCQPTTGAGLDAQTWDAGSISLGFGFRCPPHGPSHRSERHGKVAFSPSGPQGF